ncbi:putative Prolyl endopeptidase-like [Cardiosporidium cionae]|uniref:Prolyl endopeptidase-like n=1 Tax=Cardiosporidium cionae TaxID=476202 RepID=A0ABQ7JA46_9APIC|nr:putative Prolyl endopeptidase-like [Cardiosporidium cionae]|eukprot:KAF8820871.1 putative Prolyl endopeptidase-like [Cardiosporidium cionae]
MIAASNVDYSNRFSSDGCLDRFYPLKNPKSNPSVPYYYPRPLQKIPCAANHFCILPIRNGLARLSNSPLQVLHSSWKFQLRQSTNRFSTRATNLWLCGWRFDEGDVLKTSDVQNEMFEWISSRVETSFTDLPDQRLGYTDAKIHSSKKLPSELSKSLATCMNAYDNFLVETKTIRNQLTSELIKLNNNDVSYSSSPSASHLNQGEADFSLTSAPDEYFQTVYPEIMGDHIYYMMGSRDIVFQGYACYYRRKLPSPLKSLNLKELFTLDHFLRLDGIGPEQIVLQCGYLALHCSNHKTAILSTCKVHKNTDLLAYIVDLVGDESKQCRFKDLRYNRDLNLCLENVANVEFFADVTPQLKHGEGKCVKSLTGHQEPSDLVLMYYTTHDDLKRPFKIHCAILSLSQEKIIKNEVIIEEMNEAFYLDLYKTKDEYALLLLANSKKLSKAFVLSILSPLATPVKLEPPPGSTRFYCEHRIPEAHILSPLSASSPLRPSVIEEATSTLPLQPMTLPVESPVCDDAVQDSHYEEIIHINDFCITDIDMTELALVIYGWFPAAEPAVYVLPFPLEMEAFDLNRTATSSISQQTLSSTAHTSSPFNTHAFKLSPRRIDLPLKVKIGVIDVGINTDFYAHYVRFTIQGPLHRGLPFTVDLVEDFATSVPSTGRNKLIEGTFPTSIEKKYLPLADPLPKQKENDYVFHVHWIPSSDGTSRIPVTLVMPQRHSHDYDLENARTITSVSSLQSTTCHDPSSQSNTPLGRIHFTSSAITFEVDTQPMPCVVYAYGAYGLTVDLSYSPEHRFLLDRGWMLAFLHTRGGGELGEEWHTEGCGLNKWHSFQDLVDAIHYLISRNWTCRGKIAAKAHSAGGLLFGWLLNNHPELISCLILEAPFVDTLSAMLDPSLSLTIHEYDEWGRPEMELFEIFEQNHNSTSVPRERFSLPRPSTPPPSSPWVHYHLPNIFSYSPYENILPSLCDYKWSASEASTANTLPMVLLSTSFEDSRVPWWQVAKYCNRLYRRYTLQQKPIEATMRRRQPASGEKIIPQRVFLRFRMMSGGHFGSSSDDTWIHQMGEDMAFLTRFIKSKA